MPAPALYNLFQGVLDLLLPPSCLHCKAADSWLCQSCLDKIHVINGPICQRCGTPLSGASANCRQCQHNPLLHIDGIRVVAYFENNPIRSAIHYLKYKNHKAVAAVLSGVLAKAYHRYQLALDVIVPVPLHPARLKERGYNQSRLLADQLSHLIDLPVNTTTLKRVRDTKSQMTLGAAERRTNVTDAFAGQDEQLKAKKLLLIDDVCTTGSTLDACAAALKAAGATTVWGLTLAKAR